MFELKSKTEGVIRIFLTTVMLFNALVPTAALAASVGPRANEATEQKVPRSLPEQQPVFYDPPEIVYPQQTSPQANGPKSPVPPKEQVELTLIAEPAIVPANGVVTFHVNIRNYSRRALTALVFTDALESGMEYKPDANSPVTYDATKKKVSLSIEQLGIGEDFSFSYSLIVNSSKRTTIKGKVWLHSAEVTSNESQVNLKASVALGYGLAATRAGSELAPLKPEGGWNDLGRVAVHMPKENVGKNAMIVSSLTKLAGKGPALQFELDVFETSALAVDPQSKFNEQAVSLKKESTAAFKEPAFLEINLDGYVDLTNVPAGQEPYVATYDETHKVWIKVPILKANTESNSVTVEAAHFSTWGAGLGDALPQNGANVLLFDQPYTSLFTGSARYSIPVWAPPGRVGMQPDISLSYSSGTVDGVLGDVQAPWVGVGWNIDDVEIVRKITTDVNGYGYRDQYALTLNGSLYDLVQDEFHANRYYTDKAAFLYIERHNDHTETASHENTTGEWWEVVTTDGTRYRLGWYNHSEQLALMYGYSCTTVGSSCWPDGPYASLGYAGKAKDLVALRWRVDRVSDPHGNYMEYKYRETPSDSTIAQFDRESYLESISYTGFDDPNGDNDLSPAYQIYFKTADRTSIGDVPTEFNLWDNRDTKYLQEIASCLFPCQLANENVINAIRRYTFGYSLATVPNANGTLTLTSLKVTGGGYTENGINIPPTEAPTLRFAYQDRDNRLNVSKPFKYPRLVTVENGAGGVLTFTYGHDGRGSNSWYNYRVRNVTVDSGMAIVKKQSYTYATPVYTGQGTDPTLGNLIGYTTVTESLLDFLNNDVPVSKTTHTFGTTGLDTGREMETEWQNSSSTVLRQSTNTYVTDNTGAPKDDEGKPIAGWNYRYLKSTVNYERSGGVLTQTSKTEYYNDPYTGNLLVQSTYLGSSLYRKTYYEYVKNSAPDVYLLDEVSRIMLVDAANQVYSDTRYYYDTYKNEDMGKVPTRGDMTLVQRLTGNGNETIDTVTGYDVYGNVTSVQAYRDCGAVDTYPTGLLWETKTKYDDLTQSYPIKITDALNNALKNELEKKHTSIEYFYTLGVPYRTIDLNGWASSSTYDGLGRALAITPPGLTGPGTKFTYPPLDGNGRLSAPYSVKMEIWDALANPQPQYRKVWGLYDGVGRMLQAQTQAGNKLLVTSTQFNVQGLANQQSLPYEVSGTGGTYSYDPGSQFTASTYDALGRVTSVTAPGEITSETSYDGLTTTSLDPNGNKVSQTSDGLGRLISVAEFSDPNTVYATTTYFYDSADRLIQVKDAEFNTTTITYDWLGRKTGMDDPDMGIWSYTYDSLGNMISQTDNRECTLSFGYDELNRLKTKSSADEDCEQNAQAAYFYDSDNPATTEYDPDPARDEEHGFRTDMTDLSGSTFWNYSDFGQTVTETRTISGEQHSVTTQADWLGRAITTTYDEDVLTNTYDEKLTYTYDELGRPDQLGSEVTDQAKVTLVDLAYNTLGQISTQALGNGAVVTNTYDASTTRLKNRKTVNTSSVTLLDLSYLYDLNGNITRLTDKQLNETQFYQYDFLNRLTSAIGANGMPALAPSTPETYGQQFEYDKIGNIDQIDNWGTPPVQQQSQAPAVGLVLASNMDPTNAAGFQNVSDLRADKALLAPARPHPPVPAETSTPPPPPLVGIDDLYTVALLHMNGDDASAVFTDESGKTWTVAGNTQLDTAQGKFETTSGLFDGVGDILSTPDDSGWRLDDGSNANEWTIDFWVRFNTDPETGTQGIVQQYTSVDEFWAVRLANNTLNFLVRTAGAYSVNLSSPWDPAADTWYHVAVVKNGAAGYLMFVDGLQIGSAQTDEDPIPDFDGTLRVGDYINPSNTHYYLNGWLDELRISKGVARWTTHFTSPSEEYDFETSQPTATPTPGVDNFYTTSLLHMNGTDGSTVFGDESGKTWIALRNAQIDAADSKFGGSSALFDGTGDVLSTLDSPDWQLDAGSNANEWTIDFWVRFNTDPETGTQGIVQQYTGVNEFWAVRLANNTLNFLVRTAGAYSVKLSSPWDPAANTWYHVAVVKNGASGYLMFVDGLQIGHAEIDEDPIPDFDGTLRVGDCILPDGTHHYLNGWLDELRISKGVARWTTHFTSPSDEYLPGVSQPTPTPTPGVDNVDTVSLLHMNGTDGSKVFGDESGRTWIAAGNAQIDTADFKFGGSSGLFGGGDCLSTLDSPDWQLDSGSNARQWTIDFWVKFNGDPGTGTQGFVQQRVGGAEFWSLFLSNNALRFIVRTGAANTVNLSSPWNPAANTWYHVAVVKNGAAGYLMFVDGLQIGHAEIDADPLPDFAGTLQLGLYMDSSNTRNYLNGWLDELRISKGVARWTTHFTSPSDEYLPGVSQPTPTPTPGVDNVDTVSLLHMNGTDGSKVFGDESGRTWIAAGNAQIDTADSKFGGSSGLFGGGDSLSTLDSPDWQLDSGSNARQWTIDFWVKFNGDPGTGTQGFVQQRVGGAEFWTLRLANNKLNFLIRSGGTNIVNLSNPWNPAANTWYHVAVVKNGTAGYLMFVDGLQIGSTQTDGSVIADLDATLLVGDSIDSSNVHRYLNGWLDELRIVKGIACWTGNFDPPTMEYLPQQGTQGSLLAHWKFDSTPMSGTVSDESPVDAVDNAATLQNGAALVPEGASGNAASFDGTDDFALVANDSEIRRNGSFTLSAWVNPSAGLIDGAQYIVNKGTSGTDFDYGFVVTSTFGTPTPASPANVDPNGKLVFRVGDLTPDKVIGPILPTDTWTLVTGVYDKSKGELRLYINGKPAAIEKVTGTVAMSAADLTFSSATKAYSGKLDEVRLYNRALTDSEVEGLFGEFTIPTPPTPDPTPLPPVGTGAYDDTHSTWTYTGAWTASTPGSAANGTVHYTGTIGDTAELTFSGVQFTLMFTKGSNRGLIDVYVDGSKIDTINTYSETGLYQRTYTSPLLSEGTHTVRFVHAGADGTRIDIDQIQIYTPVTPVGSGIYDNADRIWSRSGNTQIDTAQSVFGGASARFDGTGDSLSTLDSPDFHFGSGDFTIDFQVRFKALPAAGSHSMLFNQADGSNKQSLSLFNSNGTYAWQYVVTEAGTDTVRLSFADSGVEIGAWYHIALVRSGDNWYLFRDGAQLSNPQVNKGPVPDVVAPVWIGRDPGNSLYDFNGWLDEFRISKGVARWIANFASDLPTAEYTDLSDTVALLHMNGSDGDTVFRNEVDTPWRYSGSWTASMTTGPANGTLHSTSTKGDSAELTFNGVQFTFTFTKASTRGSIDVYVDGTRVDTINANSTTTLWQQTWTSTTYPLGTHTVRFVSATAGGIIDIDQIQIFDAPAMPVGPGIYDDADQIWSPTGNAQIDTAQSIFGGASALFDGTGDYLSVPDSADFNFGTDSFTIDFRVRFNALPAAGKYSTLFSQVSGDNKQVLSLSNSSGTYIWQYVVNEGGSETVLLSFADTGLAVGTWYHVALVRDGNNWYLFRNGAQKGVTITNESAVVVPDIAAVVYIGHDKSNSLYDFNGWLDEFRISKGVARWTPDLAPFTPPATEYTDTTNVVALLHMNGLDGATTFKNEIVTPWRYSGAWRLSQGTGPANATLHYNDTVGDYAELLFEGVQFTLSFTKATTRGKIHVYVDGTRVDTINAYSATTLYKQTYLSPILEGGVHTVRFVHGGVRERIDIDAIQVHEVPTTSTTPVEAPVGAGIYDDTHNAWRYSVNWTAWTGTGPASGTMHHTDKVGKYTELTFNGTQFTLTFAKTSTRGSIDVYVDSVKVDTVNAYNATTLWQQTWTSPTYPAGAHVVRLVHAGASGTKIDIDQIEIIDAPVAPVGPGTYDDTDSAWRYSGVWTTWTGPEPASGTLHKTSLAGSYAEMLFNGRQFTLTFTKAASRGVIEIYLDGTRIKTINTYNETTLWQQIYTSPVYPAGLHTVRIVYRDGHTLIDVDQIQIDGVPAPLGVEKYDDMDSAWFYSGTWTASSNGGAYKDTLHYTETVGDYAETQFNGTQFTLTFTKAASRGKADVYVDGNKITTINAYSETTLWQQTWTSPVFAAGTHSLRLVYAGSKTYIDVDALQIYDTSVATAAVEPYDDDTAGIWTYTGAWTQPTNSEAYSTTLHSTGTVGAAAQVTFRGTQFMLYFTKDSNRGLIDVYVDELKVTTINAHSATTLYQQTYTSPVYLSGTHTVRFVYAGNYTTIDVDAIQILNTPPSPSAPPAWQSSEYTYSVGAPHAVAAVNRHTFEDSFTYDENGNMTCRVESGVTYRQKYNAENRISSIAKIDGDDCDNLQAEIFEVWSYQYDGDGVRVSTAHFTGSSTTADSFTRYYFGGAYETTGSTWKKYYSFGGTTVAMRDEDGFKYFLSDHLGSTSVILSETGTILEQQRYLPFGQARVMPPYASVTSTDFTYTGQRNLTGTGLMDYKARFYSPTLGRFIQPDTIIPSTADPQSWNRYSYVQNNPVIRNDPTGHCPWCIVSAIAGAAVSAGLYIWSESQQADGIDLHINLTVDKNGINFDAGNDWGDLLWATGMGAAAGALIGTGVGAAAGTAMFTAGMAGASMGTALAVDHYENIRNGENFSASEHVGKGVIAAIATALYVPLASAWLTANGVILTATNVGLGTGVMTGIGYWLNAQICRADPSCSKEETNEFRTKALLEMIPGPGEGPVNEFLFDTAVEIGKSEIERSHRKSTYTSSGGTSRSTPLLINY